jgi:hypothetical protein
LHQLQQLTLLPVTEHLHAQAELLKLALLQKAEELQKLKFEHEQCPGLKKDRLKKFSFDTSDCGHCTKQQLVCEPCDQLSPFRLKG